MQAGQTFRADISQSRQIDRQSQMNWLVDLTEAQWNGNFNKYFDKLLEKIFKSDQKNDKIGIFTKKSDKKWLFNEKSDKKWLMEKKVTKSEKSDLVGIL